MKAAFAQFLNLRHGGTGLLFSASPSGRSIRSATPTSITRSCVRPRCRRPPPRTTPEQVATTARPTRATRECGTPTSTRRGRRASGQRAPPTRSLPLARSFNGVTTNVTLPTPIPARRLFQIPDAYTHGVATHPPAATPPTTSAPPTVSNASDSGDPFINVAQASGGSGARGGGTATYYLNNGYPNLVWSGNGTCPPSAPADVRRQACTWAANNAGDGDRQHWPVYITSTTATRISSGRVIPQASRPQPGTTWARTMARIPTTASTLTGGRR